MSNSGYFIVDDDNGYGQCFVLTGSWRDEFIAQMIQNKITVLRLSSAAGWIDEDISFVSKLEFLKGVEVYSWNIKDVSPIFGNMNLLYVGIQCNFTSIADFSKLKKLEVCKILWKDKVRGLFACDNLRHINIVDYPHESLKELSQLRYLERIQLSSKKLVTLNGIETLRFLNILDLANCPKLTNLAAVGHCSKLEFFEIEGCKKIGHFSYDFSLSNLKSVNVVDCGKVESLTPFFECKYLEKLHAIGDTVVTDGNFDFLLEHPSIRDVWYSNKSHYSLKREALMSALQQRGKA